MPGIHNNTVFGGKFPSNICCVVSSGKKEGYMFLKVLISGVKCATLFTTFRRGLQLLCIFSVFNTVNAGEELGSSVCHLGPQADDIVWI